MNSQSGWLVSALIALLIVAAPTVSAAEQALPLWEIEGERNRIFLLGSIHLLREKDHPLPKAIYVAYDEAETLIMELDMDDIDPVATQKMTNELGLIENGGKLSDLLGPEIYAEATALAELADIPLHLLDRAEPWFAAMNVEMMLLMRMGFDPSLGVESHFLERATGDGKEIEGFETMRQQLGFLDGLSAQAQQEMFLQALAEGPGLPEMMDDMIDAWKIGDVRFMEEGVLREMEQYPELNQVIVVNRNNTWAQQIEALLDDGDDYLIIVGTLHLIGAGGVPNLLSARGHTVTQMHQAAN